MNSPSSLTILVHVDAETFLEPAVGAPVPPRLVHEAVTFADAGVPHVATDAPLEEAATTVTAVDAVVLAVALIPADFARHGVRQGTA